MVIISIKRNVAIASGVAVLLLAPLSCAYFSKKASPDDIVNVIQKEVVVPPGFQKTFTDLGVKGLILVSGGGKNGEPLTIRVVTPSGTPIDLCDSGTETCELTTPAAPLLSIASFLPACGSCSDGATLRECHKDGPKKNKWYCHLGPNDQNSHHACISACR